MSTHVAGPSAKAGRRRRDALNILVFALVITVVSVLHPAETSRVLTYLWLWTGSISLYWLWLSTPRFGSATYEAAVTKNAVFLLPLVFMLGILAAGVFGF